MAYRSRFSRPWKGGLGIGIVGIIIDCFQSLFLAQSVFTDIAILLKRQWEIAVLNLETFGMQHSYSKHLCFS